MRKIIFTVLAVIFSINIGYSQVTTIWEKSAATGTKPTWEAGGFTRGISYGFVGGQHLLFVANRHSENGGKAVIYYNAVTGDSLGTLDLTGVAGGVAIINDIEVSADGKIFLGNMTTSASADPFKVYRYDSLKAVPVVALSYNATAERIGDKFTVTGSTADNSITIWAATSLASAGAGNLYKFTTLDNGLSFTSSSLPIATTASSAAVGPLPNGDFYFDAHGTTPVRYSAAGTAGAGVPGAIISTSGSALRYIRTFLKDEYIICDELTTTTNKGKILKVVNGNPATTVLYDTTKFLGSTSATGLGDVSVQKVSDFVYNVYVLSANNGFGAYRLKISPVLSGDYFIGAPGTGPGGTDPHFATLREAFDILNDATFTGNCNFYITSNTTETHTTGLGLAINPEPYTVTFKPFAGVQPVITLNYPTDVNSGPSGALVIGIPSKGNVTWDSLRTTKNIIIDGSNTVGGTTRDLTIESATNSQRNAIPLVVVGDVTNLTVKNTNIYYKTQVVSTSGSLFIGAVMIRSRNFLNKDWTPHGIIFENNHLSSNFPGVAQYAQGYGTYQTGTPNVIDYPYNITLKNNVIEGRRKGIAIYRGGSHDIIGNEILVNQIVAGNVLNDGIVTIESDTNSVFNIYNNKFLKIASIKDTTSSVGNTAIAIESFGTYNVYNNMITGFELTGTNPNGYVRGVKNSSPFATLNLYHNTIQMDDLASIGAGKVSYQGIYITDGTNNIKNNIIVNNETDLPSNCLYRTGTTGTVVSDYNNFYPVNNVVGFVGYWNNTAAGTLTEWKTLSGQDANSVSKVMFFVTNSDLHLTGASIGDVELTGTPIDGITTDIDGETRSTSYPYMGADESAVEIPVELASFSANIVDGFVQLTWKTITETNNKGFEVERKSSEAFEVIGFVSGKGNSTEPVNYSFVDNTVGTGKYIYRLKQIDLDGTISYSETLEMDNSVPITFSLSQNYPNPFNPTTTINYTIAEPVNVTLTIYNALGAEVAVLINNEFTNQGPHHIQFDASNFASGTYIYRITAGKYVETKKMILMK